MENNSQPSDDKKTKRDGSLNTQNLDFEFSRYFIHFLLQNKVSLIVCCYKSNCIFSIGAEKSLETGEPLLSFFISPAKKAMGATYNEKTEVLTVGEYMQITNYHKEGTKETDSTLLPDFDTQFIPRSFNFVNDIDIHDIVIDKNDKVYFCSALFCCICELSNLGSFKVYWKPDWISKIAAEDRCHLNGLCCRDGIPRYVTSVARSNLTGVWRQHRKNGGVVWDIVENKLICKGLSMPHSPRWHRNKLWILESGTGHFGYIDFDKKVVDESGEESFEFVKCCFIPSFVRGIKFIKDKYAVIGGSQDRYEKVFQGLELGENIKKNGGIDVNGKSGIYIIDLDSFDIVHSFTFNGDEVKELYDVTPIPNSARPCITPVSYEMAMDFKIIE